MILSQQHFWRHIARCPARLMSILGFPISGNSQISNPTVAVLVDYDVLRFHIAMYYVPQVQMLKTLDDTTHYEFCVWQGCTNLFFGEIVAVVDIVA